MFSQQQRCQTRNDAEKKSRGQIEYFFSACAHAAARLSSDSATLKVRASGQVTKRS